MGVDSFLMRSNNMKYLITFIMLLFVSTANANTPDWVLGKGHNTFPDDKYLVGVGVSEKSPILASQSARAELIKTIRVKVNSVVSDFNSRDKSVSKSTIVTETDFLLEGSQVKDGWYDSRNNVFYSLVVIERQYVLETLKVMIEHILASIELSLRQADTFLNNGEIVRALVYYYNGFNESTKLLPYIQTYNSVIMVKDKQEYKDEYNLLFKEKIQNIVDNINLEKHKENINDNDLDLNVKATLNGRGINNFPVKFSSSYNHYVERILCNKTGHCQVNPLIENIVNRNNNILIEAEVDLQTLEKYFNHRLKRNLFGRLELINVSFKIKNEERTRPHVVKHNKHNKQNRELTPWERCCANDIDLSPLRKSRTLRNNGHINFGIRFGNRGNINIHRGW
jgi:hypothetical protein